MINYSLLTDVNIQLLPNFKGELKYQNDGDSGFDLTAGIDKPITLEPNETKLVPNGFKLSIPNNTEVQVRSRSGLSLKHGIVVKNSPGTVDSGYRGEVATILYNSSDKPFTINPGDRIAQGVLCPILKARFTFVNDGELDSSTRGTGGFGSTGV
jgi:dUTP pyrophosphatase